MRTDLTLLVAVALAGAAGCSHTQTVHVVPPHLIGHDVEIHTAGGLEADAHAVSMPGGIAWRSNAGSPIPGRRVTKVVVTHRVKGALEGLGFGLAGGLAVGVVAAATYKQAPCRPDGFAPCLDFGGLVELAGSIAAGVVIGPIVGALIGDRDIYKISAAPDAPRVSVVPTKAGATAAVAWKF